MTTLEVINPIPGKGLSRPSGDVPFLARAQIMDEHNYIEIGLIVRDATGAALDTAQVSVTTSDSSQNKTLNGTGNVTKIYVNGQPMIVPYYPFHYEFRTPGDHDITFTVNGVPADVPFAAVPP